jgi:hypothetical protein
MLKLVLSAMTVLHTDLKIWYHLRVHLLHSHACHSVFQLICTSITQLTLVKTAVLPANFAQALRISVLSVRRDMNSTLMQHQVNVF